MPQVSLQQINLGGYANDGTGDDLRTAFSKVISNFEIVKAAIPSSLAEDTTPTLGGNLNLNGKNLYSNNNVALTIPAGKKLTVSGAIEATSFIGTVTSIGNHNLDALSDVVIEEEPTAGESLVFDGNIWKPGAVSATFTTVDGGSAVTIYSDDVQAVVDGGFA